MLDSLQFMASFQLGNPLCELIAGFPFEMTADLFTFGYSASIVIFFFFNVSYNFHNILCASKRKEIFSIKWNTKGNTMLYSQRCVCGRQKPFSLKPRGKYRHNLCVHLYTRLKNTFKRLKYTISARMVVKKENFTKIINGMNVCCCRVLEFSCPCHMTILKRNFHWFLKKY